MRASAVVDIVGYVSPIGKRAIPSAYPAVCLVRDWYASERHDSVEEPISHYVDCKFTAEALGILEFLHQFAVLINPRPEFTPGSFV
jgi:hypothetical protein